MRLGRVVRVSGGGGERRLSRAGRGRGGLKLKVKELGAGQRREAGGHRLGWDIPGRGNIKKVNIDEVSGRQK